MNTQTLPNLASLFEKFKKHHAEQLAAGKYDQPMGLIKPTDHYVETEHLRDQIKKETI